MMTSLRRRVLTAFYISLLLNIIAVALDLPPVFGPVIS